MAYDYEVLIIGAGPAGLSAAMTLGRIGRRALVVDDGRPRNAASNHLNNFPTQDGIHPAEWRKKAREDLKKYQSVHTKEDQVLSVTKVGLHFLAQFKDSPELRFRKVILAYGIQDRLPLIPGFQELWGKSVFHCPFCHGFEVRHKPLALVSNGVMAEHAIPLIYALSRDLIVFTNGPAEIPQSLRQQMEKKNILLKEEKITSLNYSKENLESLELEDGSSILREAIFASPILPFQQKSSIGDQLGCEKNEMGLVKINERGATTVPGVFAAGDNMTFQHSVLLAAGHGVVAGSSTIFELVQEDISS